MNLKKFAALLCSGVVLFETVIAGSLVTFAADGDVLTESSVTAAMCNPDYWKSIAKDPDKILMDTNQIALYNQLAMGSEDANMHDILNMDELYDATSLASGLAKDAKEFAKNKSYLYINTQQVVREDYTSAIASYIEATGYHGIVAPQYAVAVKRTEINSLPTNAYVGYSATDFDEEACLGILNVNEPFVIKQLCAVAGELFYFGYSNNVSGWVNANDLAVCANKNEWLNAWQTSLTGKDFVVINESSITLDKEAYLPYMSGVKLSLGTILKLVPEKDTPNTLAERAPWHNYVVYIPTRDENGRYKKEMALISQRHNVSVGFLPLTQSNLLDIMFSCLGDRYGWGGSLDSFDCSLYTRTVYRCFGIEMPRNTSWQTKVPGTCIDAASAPDELKISYLKDLPAGTLLYFPGHTMIYLGNVDGTPYCISALGSVVESTGDIKVRSVYSVAITPLDVRRKSGLTWINCINSIVNPKGL